MKLKYLKMKAFRSFAGEETIEFPESGLVLIDGGSVETGESNGSGKSNVLAAIATALGIGPYDLKDCQSWLSDEPWQIELGLSTNSGDVVIGKGRENFIKIGDHKTTGAKNIQETSGRLFGIPLDVLAALTYRMQESKIRVNVSSGVFLSKTNAEIHSFLNSLINVEKYEMAVEIAQERLSILKAKYELAANSLKSLTDQQAELEAGRISYEIQPTQILEKEENILFHQILVSESESKELIQKIAQTEQEIVDVKALNKINIDKALDPLNRALADLKIEEISDPEYQKTQSKLSEIQKQKTIVTTETQKLALGKANDIKKIDEKLSVISKAEANSITLAKKIEQEKAKLEALAKAECPTCHQSWDKYEQEKQTVELAIATDTERLNLLLEVVARLPDLNFQKSALTMEPTSHTRLHEIQLEEREISSKLSYLKSAAEQRKNQAIEANRVKEQDIKNQILQIRRKFDATLEPTQKMLDTLKSTSNQRTIELAGMKNKQGSIRSNIQSIKNQNSMAEKMMKQQSVSLEKMTRQIAESTGTIESHKKEILLEESFIEVVGNKGFLNAIFSDILNEISSETNEQLAKLSNVSDLTLQFVTEMTTDNKKIKKSITPMVYINGVERRIGSSLSGGMQTSLAEAVEVALIRIVERRAGISLGWLMLDEAFDGMSSSTKESSLDILSTLAEDRLILVIDHSSEFKEKFSKVINVEFSNRISRIV